MHKTRESIDQQQIAETDVQKLRIAILITTYNRPDELLMLLRQIHIQGKNFEIIPIIINDGSSKNYSLTVKFLKNFIPFTIYLNSKINNGKRFYWKTINLLYSELKNIEFDYCIQIPDDIKLCDNFFDTAICQYKVISDNKKICLNLLNDYSRKGKMWTSIEPKDVTFCDIDFIRTGWVDMCYIATRKFFENLEWIIEVPTLKFVSDVNKSSGVGMNISQRIVKKGFSFYQVKNSLVIHGDHASVMHPQTRKQTKLISNHNMDKIIYNVATIPARVHSLRETINSIYKQADVINVFLNLYDEVPEFLKQPKINLFTSQEYGDLGDAGKFFKIADSEGYYFTIDDDIIYPADYTAIMVNEIEKHQRKAVISAHGRILKNKCKSYYHDYARAYACLRDVEKNVIVHCPGTGVTAFHTSTVKVSIENFEYKNMADIWLGIACNNQDVDVVCIKHKAGWIKESQLYDSKHTIYQNCHKSDEIQTKIINQEVWKKLT